jgi:hypothetical protein
MSLDELNKLVAFEKTQVSISSDSEIVYGYARGTKFAYLQTPMGRIEVDPEEVGAIFARVREGVPLDLPMLSLRNAVAHNIALHEWAHDVLHDQSLKVSAIGRATRAGLALDGFAWFCHGETRESVRLTAGDLRKDVRDMLAEHRSAWHILAVQFWITTTTIGPIVWDGCVRVMKKVPIVGAWIRAVSAFLRKIDPPRLG